MNTHYSPFYTEIDLEDEEKTWPPVGSSVLTIEIEYKPLFISAYWVIYAKINGHIVAESDETNVPKTRGELRQWARAFIRQEKMSLRRFGVDVMHVYKQFGGIEQDIEND